MPPESRQSAGESRPGKLLLITSIGGPIGGLLIAYGAFQSKPNQHGGFAHIFTSPFVWVGVAIVLATGVTNLVLFVRTARRRSRSAGPSAAQVRLARPVPEWTGPPVPAVGADGVSGKWYGGLNAPGTMGRSNASIPLAVLELTPTSVRVKLRLRWMAAMHGVKELRVSLGDETVLSPGRGVLGAHGIALAVKDGPTYFFWCDWTCCVDILNRARWAGFVVDDTEKKAGWI